MDAFQALLKLILDEKSLNDIKSRVNKEIRVKVGADTTKAKSEVVKMASELNRLTKVNSMQTWANNNSKAMKVYGAQINSIISQISDLGNAMPKEELDKLVTQFKSIQNNARMAGNIGQTFGDKMSAAWQKFGQWGLASATMMKVWHEFKEGVQFVKELDDALTDVAYTSNVSKAQLEKLGKSSVQMAKDLSASATNVLEAVKIYSTAKATADDILRKSKPAIMLSNVSGMSGADASKTIQTALNQFELEDTESTLMDIVDILEYTSSQLNYDFTEGMKQITEGIEASGSVAKNAGLDMQEYAAMVGVAVEKTGQSGSTIGNAYKTIFSRITKASEVEGTLAENISKAEEALRGINVQVRSSDNDFRDMTDIMADIGKVWDSLDDKQKSHVGYEVAGIRQVNVLNSLFGAWEEYSEIVENSGDRVGMTLKNQEEYVESIGGRLEELGSTGKSVWNNILNSDLFKGSISLLTDVLGLVDKITGALGSVGSVGLGVGLFAGLKNVGINMLVAYLSNVLNYRQYRVSIGYDSLDYMAYGYMSLNEGAICEESR